MVTTLESSPVENKRQSDLDSLASDEGIGSLVMGLQGITEFMTGVGSKFTRYLPLPYPNKGRDEDLEAIPDEFIGAQSLPLNQLQLPKKRYYIPGVPVTCKIVGWKKLKKSEFDFQSKYLYTIRLKHGPFVWEVFRRYRQFSILHSELVDYVEKLEKASIKDIIGDKNVDSEDIPKLPLPSDAWARLDRYAVLERQAALEAYLVALLRCPQFLTVRAMLDFLEVSVISFIAELGPRYKEGILKKRPLDDFSIEGLWDQMSTICNCYNLRHQERWFAAKDSYLCFFSLENNELGFPLLLDRKFRLSYGFRKTAFPNGLKVSNLQTKLYLHAGSSEEFDEWIDALNTIKQTSGDFVYAQRYGSFAPVRKSTPAQWFIDGRSYMNAVADVINSAKEQIFITDWWLSPEIYLKRPLKDGDKSWRLDHLLARKADEGVLVYVLLFQEVRAALSIDSLHSKVALRSRNPERIKVMRHPRINLNNIFDFYWSHHEKIVVVDQTIAFVGGIDLCFGRWDDQHYRLVDLAGANDRKLLSASELAQTKLKLADRPVPVIDSVLSSNEPATQPPVRSTAEKTRRAFSLLPKHGNAENASDDDVFDDINYGSPRRAKWHFVRQAIRLKQLHGTDLDRDSDEEATVQPISDDIEPEAEKNYLWPGKDYSNCYKSDSCNVKDFNEDQINRFYEPRMPWHDGAAVVLGDAAQDVARHFIQRWNHVKREKHRDNSNYQYLLPKSYPARPPDERFFSRLHSVDAQVVRSIARWSGGGDIVEASIADAYIGLIGSSKHYLLIENQFFITSCSVIKDRVTNAIGEALLKRIIEAHRNKENFRVYVILPLLPGFDSHEAIQAILYYTMMSINKGPHSLYGMLREQGGITEPQRYINFFGMRNYDILSGRLVTEVVYVHSKIMICDDRRAIVGSANINDRSMLGTRDSEVALVLEDTEMVMGVMDGRPTEVGKLCSSWRKTLFSQALGVDGSAKNPINIEDPVSQEFYDQFCRIAKNNTEIYQTVFKCVPSDDIRTFKEVSEWRESQKECLAYTDPHKALLILREKLQGYIVDLPILFLDGAYEKLTPKKTTKEGLVPYRVWT